MVEKGSNEARERMARVRAAKNAKRDGAPAVPATPEVQPQGQCVYCGVYFEPRLLADHQRLVHKGEAPVEEPIPTHAAHLAPGSIIRIAHADGQVGVPAKVPWTRDWVEHGYECGNSACKDPTKTGWRVIVRENDPVPACGVCGGPLHQMFPMVDWDAPEQAPVTVSFNRVTYRIRPGETNRIPSIIRDIARQSMNETRRASDGLPKLESVGLLPPLVEDNSMPAGQLVNV